MPPIPRPDSVSSALAMYLTLTRIGKEVTVVCTDLPGESARFLPSFDAIEVVDFNKFNFEEYDLFFILDTSSWDRVVGSSSINFPDIETIQIDHHATNDIKANINLLDPKSKSTSEMIYFLFQNWKVDIDRDISTCLLTGIIGDTGSFQYSVNASTLTIAAELIKKGASKDEICFHLYRNIDFNNLAILGNMLGGMNISDDGRYAWTALSYDALSHLGPDLDLGIMDLILQSIKGTEFAFRILEKKPGLVSVSFRARRDFDTSKIAKALGGGGHAVASGAAVEGEFNEAVKKVLDTVRLYIND